MKALLSGLLEPLRLEFKVLFNTTGSKLIFPSKKTWVQITAEPKAELGRTVPSCPWKCEPGSRIRALTSSWQAGCTQMNAPLLPSLPSSVLPFPRPHHKKDIC